MKKRLSTSEKKRLAQKTKLKSKIRQVRGAVARAGEATVQVPMRKRSFVLSPIVSILVLAVIFPLQSQFRPTAAIADEEIKPMVAAPKPKAENKKVQAVPAVPKKADQTLKITAAAKLPDIATFKKNDVISVAPVRVGAESIKIVSPDLTVIPSVSPKPEAEEVKDTLREEIAAIVKERPIKAMIDDIAKRDRQVAAFLVGIALKESSFGVHSPKNSKGEECYNYWGYRGWENRTKSGYSCFDSPSHAVEVVGNRIEELVDQGRTTPAKMVVWKCGYTCAGFPDEDVQSWINDVSINYNKLKKKTAINNK